MPLLARACPWAILAVTAGGMAMFGRTEPDPEPIPGPKVAVPAVARQYGVKEANYVGATSCAAAACHGGDHHDQYQVWAGQNADGTGPRDPHSKAYRVLFNNVSRNIARNLEASLGRYIPAHENSLCLKCHAQTKFETVGYPAQQVSHENIADKGVGCESCHGPADKYLSTHYLPSFKALSTEEKAKQFGLYPTKDLSFRTQMCAACHMGDSSREVNHDLIAAGHPRLMFEYTAFHNRKDVYERHWQEKDPHGDFDVRAWVLGQAANIRSAVDVLKMRATAAKHEQEDREKKGETTAAARHPWPEFAEYSCYACHQNLMPDRKSWKEASTWEHRLGSAPWGTWTLPTLGALEKISETVDCKALLPVKELKVLRSKMEDPASKPADIIASCDAAEKGLNAWIPAFRQALDSSSHLDRSKIRDEILANALNKTGEKFNNLDWDGVMQHYLGLKAAGVPSDLDYQLKQIGAALKFPRGYDNPVAPAPQTILDGFKALRTNKAGATTDERKPDQ